MGLLGHYPHCTSLFYICSMGPNASRPNNYQLYFCHIWNHCHYTLSKVAFHQGFPLISYYLGYLRTYRFLRCQHREGPILWLLIYTICSKLCALFWASQRRSFSYHLNFDYFTSMVDRHHKYWFHPSFCQSKLYEKYLIDFISTLFSQIGWIFATQFFSLFKVNVR